MYVLFLLDDQPEWFSEDVTQDDKIELKGFDGHHQEKAETKEKRDGEKKKKDKKKVL